MVFDPFGFFELLQQRDLILATTPPPPAIFDNLSHRAQEGKPIRIMYGETYDRFGPTVDSLKYYFVVAALGKILGQHGWDVEPAILIADIAACRNEPEEHASELLAIGQRRAALVRGLSQLYRLNLTVKLMSEYLYTDAFQGRLERVRAEAEGQPDIDRWIKQTVPASKVEIETEKGFAYAYEEVATIVAYDVKVGPPREQFYDEPARLLGPALSYPALQSVYLRPTYPLGLGRDFFFENEEIEQFGVTAYKAGSKNLAQHRIILGETSDAQIQQLIARSFVSKKPSIPNPVLDIAVIAEMAQQWLQGELGAISIGAAFLSGEVSADGLRQLAFDHLRRYVLEPIQPLLSAVESGSVD